MNGRGCFAAALTLLLVGSAAPSGAQGIVRHTAAPRITADGEAWLQRGEPVIFGGSAYYPAGPTVFFEEDRMVRSGWYRGIPLYTDVTLEPFSIVFVPVARGLMQPYERRRAGPLAGTSGSRTPAFPVSTTGQAARARAVPPVPDTGWPVGLAIPQAPAPPTRAYRSPWPHPVLLMPIVVKPVIVLERPEPQREEPRVPQRLETTERPAGLNAVWITYRAERWFFAGPSVQYSAEEYERTEDHEGFRTYRRRDGLSPGRVYVEVVDGLLAPYQRR